MGDRRFNSLDSDDPDGTRRFQSRSGDEQQPDQTPTAPPSHGWPSQVDRQTLQVAQGNQLAPRSLLEETLWIASGGSSNVQTRSNQPPPEVVAATLSTQQSALRSLLDETLRVASGEPSNTQTRSDQPPAELAVVGSAQQSAARSLPGETLGVESGESSNTGRGPQDRERPGAGAYGPSQGISTATQAAPPGQGGVVASTNLDNSDIRWFESPASLQNIPERTARLRNLNRRRERRGLPPYIPLLSARAAQ
jgi:hypothetical protein